jgi:hypothetical protein
VNTQQSDLPGYEEIIANPAAKLEGLSTVHSGLGDAAESLVLVHHEIDETKRRIESLALSTQSMVEEVQRLQPSELAATLDASLVSFSRESSESLGAMSQRVLTVASEIAASRNRVDEGFASLERQVTAQHDAISQGVANINPCPSRLVRFGTWSIQPMSPRARFSKSLKRWSRRYKRHSEPRETTLRPRWRN